MVMEEAGTAVALPPRIACLHVDAKAPGEATRALSRLCHLSSSTCSRNVQFLLRSSVSGFSMLGPARVKRWLRRLGRQRPYDNGKSENGGDRVFRLRRELVSKRIRRGAESSRAGWPDRLLGLLGRWIGQGAAFHVDESADSVMNRLLAMRSGRRLMVSTRRPDVMEASSWTKATRAAAPWGSIPVKEARKMDTA